MSQTRRLLKASGPTDAGGGLMPGKKQRRGSGRPSQRRPRKTSLRSGSAEDSKDRHPPAVQSPNFSAARTALLRFACRCCVPTARGQRHGVKSSPAQGMTAKEAADSQPRSPKGPMLLQRLQGVGGTRGPESAAGREERADAAPVKTDAQDQQCLHHPEPRVGFGGRAAPLTGHTLPKFRSLSHRAEQRGLPIRRPMFPSGKGGGRTKRPPAGIP